MKPVTVGRYKAGQDWPKPPDEHCPWLGWVETEDWIVWAHEDGTVYVVNGRTPDGAILGVPVSVARATAETVTLVGGVVVTPTGISAPLAKS